MHILYNGKGFIYRWQHSSAPVIPCFVWEWRRDEIYPTCFVTAGKCSRANAHTDYRYYTSQQ